MDPTSLHPSHSLLIPPECTGKGSLPKFDYEPQSVDYVSTWVGS